MAESKTGSAGKGISRRAFLATAAAATAAVAASGERGLKHAVATPAPTTPGDPFADCSLVYGCCSPECQHHSLKGYVRDGKLVKVEAGEVNESGICPRGVARVEMVNSDQRLTMPLKATGPKGSGQFEEISWDDAFDLIEQHIDDAVASDGSKSIAYSVYSGNFSNLSANVWGAFFSWIGDGCTPLVDNLCCAGVDGGMTPVLGKRYQATRDQFVNSDYVIFWGCNPAVTLGGYFQRFEEVKDKGGTLCTIDPYYSESAAKSQEWLQVYPGSDVALGLHMLNAIITEGLVDRDYLLAHTTAACVVDPSGTRLLLRDENDATSYEVYGQNSGQLVACGDQNANPALSLKGTPLDGQYQTVYDMIAERAAAVDDETLERECGISAADARRVARDYATAPHAMIIHNMGGMQRTEYGVWAVAIGIYIALFTGNIGHVGDGVYDAGGISNITPAGAPFEVNKNVSHKEKLHRVHFGEQIENDEPYKINMLFMANGNLASQAPNTNMVKKGLEKIPFVVTADLFMTATAQYSDLVLPVTAVFERDDVTASSRSKIISISEAGVKAPAQAKSDLEIASTLAEHYGFGDKFNDTPAHYISKVLAPYNISYERLKEEKAIDMRDPDWIAFKDGNFSTKSGRAEIFVTKWEDEGFPPVVEFRRTHESVLNATDYPLAAVQRKTYRTVHTTFSQLDSLQKIFAERPPVIINAQDAADRNIETGDTVTVFNDRGQHVCRAVVSERVKRSVVVLENGWQDGVGYEGTSSSNVTNNAFPTLGTTHTCNSTLVDVRKGE